MALIFDNFCCVFLKSDILSLKWATQKIISVHSSVFSWESMWIITVQIPMLYNVHCETLDGIDNKFVLCKII